MTRSIALVRRRYTPYGGAERTAALLCSRLAERGARVGIAASAWPGGEGQGEWIRIPSPRKPSWLGALLFALRCAKDRRLAGFDVVLSLDRTLRQDVYRAGDGCHRTWLRKRAAADGFVKGRLVPLLRPLNWVNLFLEKRVFDPSRTGIVVANSRMVAGEVAAEYGFPPNRIRVVANGVDRERFLAMGRAEAGDLIRKRYGIGADRKVLLFLGSGFHRKGLAFAIRALGRLEGDAVLLAAGKGRTGPFLSLAGRLGVRGRVVFAGPVEDPVPLLRGADVLLLPTLYDPCSNVCLEAIVAGTPVVTTMGNGASEFILDRRHGRVVDAPWDVVGLAHSCAELLENPAPIPPEAAAHVPTWGKAVEDLLAAVEGAPGFVKRGLPR